MAPICGAILVEVNRNNLTFEIKIKIFVIIENLKMLFTIQAHMLI